MWSWWVLWPCWVWCSGGSGSSGKSGGSFGPDRSCVPDGCLNILLTISVTIIHEKYIVPNDRQMV